MDEETADYHIVSASTNTTSYTNVENIEIGVNSEESVKDQQFGTVADKKYIVWPRVSTAGPRWRKKSSWTLSTMGKMGL